jgi:D-inositol-3-phosphate glycosyltransferase
LKNLEVLIFSGDPRKILKKERTESGLRQQLKNSVKRFGLEQCVKLHNGLDQDKLHRYFGAADIVVVPSFYESFGMVAVEAMATGTPVVASNVGGLQWTIEDGITGFHAKAGNPRDFARQILKIINDKQLEERLAENAKIHVQNNFSWALAAERTAHIYKTLLEK